MLHRSLPRVETEGRSYNNLTGIFSDGTPKGNRTPVSAVRGRRPRPLDDGSISSCRRIDGARSECNTFLHHYSQVRHNFVNETTHPETAKRAVARF